MKKLLPFLILIFSLRISLAQNVTGNININDPGARHQLIGELGEKLGSMCTVKGIVIDGSTKGYEGGPNLMVQMINERPTQVPMQIPLSPYVGMEFDNSSKLKIETGSTYSLRVYESGEFVGVPDEAYKEAGLALQTCSHYFRNRLVVISGEKINAIEWSPVNFPGQTALLTGIAKNERDTAVIVTSSWKLKLMDGDKWEKSEIGKAAEVYGDIQKTNSNTAFQVKNCRKQLVNLEDQVGKTVKLRGRAISMNDDWWFDYRGTDISVEKMKELPNWSGKNHFQTMEISGVLEKAKASDQCHTEYIIRHASWTPIPYLLSPELDLTK